MKVAIVTEDKVHISDHLGGAPYFVVITVEQGNVVGREIREKFGHEKYAGEEDHPQTDEKGRHGFGPQASERHKEIYEIIRDCGVLIAGRMGFGAYEDMRGFAMKVIATDVKNIDKAITLLLKDELPHLMDRIC